MPGPDRDDELLTSKEVAELFGVTARTVTRWADQGKLAPIRTLGGHRRYRVSEVEEFLEELGRDGHPPGS